MVDELTRAQAGGRAAYALTRLHTSSGRIAPHYLHPSLVPDEKSFMRNMGNPHFAEIVTKEESAEDAADGPLDDLAALAPMPRAHDLFLSWLAFINVDLDPWTTGGSIHFRPHWARVLMLSLALGESEKLPPDDLTALCMAAVFHDSRRRDPYLDTGHGARAAEYYRAFCGETDTSTRRSVVGKRIVFDPRTYLAVAWHDRDDDAGIAAIERSVREAVLYAPATDDDRADTQGVVVAACPSLEAVTPAEAVHLYRMFKDADGLDRIRLGSSDLDKRFLRTEHALELLPYAHDLLSLTNAHCKPAV